MHLHEVYVQEVKQLEKTVRRLKSSKSLNERTPCFTETRRKHGWHACRWLWLFNVASCQPDPYPFS